METNIDKDVKRINFTFDSSDGIKINTYKWFIENSQPKGIIQISHGMAETVMRYDYFANYLAKNGYVVYGNDHRGHGGSVKDLSDLGYLGGEGGFERLIEDISILTDLIKKENPNLPIILFAHSMGSFASQRYIMDYKDKIQGLILSGSNGNQGTVLKLGRFIAGMEMRLRGDRAKSELLNKMSFGSYNNNFKPTRTEFDWLSRDDKEVDKYIDDTYCGSVFTTSFYREFFGTLMYIEDEKNLLKIPRKLPIFIISGDKDPVGNFGIGIENLYNRYKKAGVENVEYKLYPGARHELLNETNREEVMVDVVNWIDGLIENLEG